MSLLNSWNTVVTVYPEKEYIDADGNRMTTWDPDNPYELKVMIQPLPQSGTSARRAEQDNEGFEIETSLRMRVLPGAAKIDSQARLDWNGEWWSIIGDPLTYNGSKRTRHTEYTIRRN